MQALLTRTPKIASLAIRARLCERYSHAMGIESHRTILDATFTHGGVRRRSIGDALAGVDDVLELLVPLPDEGAGLAWARNQLGASYDWSAILSFGIAPRDWLDDPRRWFCFELIAGWWRAGGLEVFSSHQFVTGEDLIEAARQHGVVRPRMLTLQPPLSLRPEWPADSV